MVPKVEVGEKGPERVFTPDELKKMARPVKKKSVRGKRAAGADRPAIIKEPRGQQSGAIRQGPANWIVCTICTKLFSTKDKTVRYGVRPRHAAKHLADHRMGRIKRPTGGR